MTEMSCFQINKLGMPLMGERFSCRLAFIDMGEVIDMKQVKKKLKKRKITTQSMQDTGYVEFPAYFIIVIEH